MLAVECLGLFCIQDSEAAALQHLPLFLQVLRLVSLISLFLWLQICSSDAEELQIVSMKILFDILLCANWRRLKSFGENSPAEETFEIQKTEKLEAECLSVSQHFILFTSTLFFFVVLSGALNQ